MCTLNGWVTWWIKAYTDIVYMKVKNLYLHQELTAFRRNIKAMFCYQNEMCALWLDATSIFVSELEAGGLLVVFACNSTISAGCIIEDLRGAWHPLTNVKLVID